MKFSDIWLFRNFQNALLGFVGMSGVSYIVYTAYNEKKFSSPIVAEALKILTRSSKATDILGIN